MLHKFIACIIKFKYFLYKIRKFIIKKISDNKRDDSAIIKTIHFTIWVKMGVLRLIKGE